MLMHQALNAVNGVQKLFIFFVLFYVLSNIEIYKMFTVF